ncbi:hypothetical protein H2204_012154 [Knufia peltigerae]|uniref:Uncharacterized protein n=1 Tax=Knufia peltigerae TaxID=1002370 RepID=A0AA38XT84_9EURO|nr:hypothetical protein H2204_012154 [Knufia peltigerae]
MAYLDAFPSSWSRKSTAPSGAKRNDDSGIVIDETPTTFIPTYGKFQDDDKSESLSNDGFNEARDVGGLSDERADPTADLVAAGIIARDYAYMTDSLTAKESLTTTGRPALGLGRQASDLPRNKWDETSTLARGPHPQQEVAAAPLSAASRVMSTASQLGKETIESDGRTAQYLSEFPESWLQPRRPNKTAHSPITESHQRRKLMEFAPPSFQQHEESTPLFPTRDDSSNTQDRGSRGDVMPRHPGKRSEATFVARGHFELTGAAAAISASSQKFGNVTERTKAKGLYATPFPKMNPIIVHDSQARDSHQSTTSTSSMASNYSTMPGYHDSRSSHGDTPPTFRRMASND